LLFNDKRRIYSVVPSKFKNQMIKNLIISLYFMILKAGHLSLNFINFDSYAKEWNNQSCAFIPTEIIF